MLGAGTENVSLVPPGEILGSSEILLADNVSTVLTQGSSYACIDESLEIGDLYDK